MNASKDVRNSLGKMRKFIKGEEITSQIDESKKPLDMREMLKRARKMNEDVNTDQFNVEDITNVDKETQQEKIQNAFKDQDVYVSVEEFKQYNDANGNPIAFFLSGGIDGVITFDLKVGKTEDTSGIDWTATPDFRADQRNNEILKRLKDYYKEFYEEWRESLY